VLELVALGLTSREIADGLFLSRQGVTYHIATLFTKLGARTRAGLVGRAYALGALTPGIWPPRRSLVVVPRPRVSVGARDRHDR
jgi:hypothetical protein